MNETLYVFLTGTLSAIAAWIIISAIKYVSKLGKDLISVISDMKKIKKEIEEMKIRINNIEENRTR
ncbi:MAG: hypothetical protein D4R88_08745 [Methanosarcinales archaeon]|nr:MAG: hypothetical protein D4R88_08745 [Methanosarcinales archaeon]